MRFVTNLMDRIFSDSTPEEFKDKVSEKIDEAKANGSAELKEGEDHLSFAESNGDVVIEDKAHDNEVTVAKEDGGEYKLEGVPTTKTQSATEPDANAVIPAGTTKAPLKPDATLDDAKVDDIKAVVINEDKAGVGKHFSLKFEGFKSEAEAQKFYSELHKEGEVLSFSETELAHKAEEANELNKLAERVEGTKDPELAAELKTKAEELKAYSVLAAGQGYEMSDLYEAASSYSEYADDVLTQTFSNMDINEYFSQLDEDAFNAYFSGLDEVESDVLYSALNDEENTFTFSEVQQAIDACYSEAELSTPITEYFSDMTEDEINSYFSDFDEDTMNTIFSVLEDNEDATFSDVNEVLSLSNTLMTELFSDMTEDEIKAYSEEVGEEVANIAFSMAIDEDENYTYSDFLEVVEYMSTYSEEDVDQLSKNADEIAKATEDMKSSDDAELAKKVKVLAEATAEEAEIADKQGLEGAKEICDKCHSFSDAAEEVLIKNGINPKSIDAEKVMEEVAEAKKAADEAEAAAKKAEEEAKAAEEAKKAEEEAAKKAAEEAEAAKKAAEEAEAAKKAAEEAAAKEATKTASDTTFDEIDTDHDGKISKEELEAADKELAVKFEEIDTDKDGFISKEEFAAAKATPAKETKTECERSYSYLFQNAENRTFSATDNGKEFGKVNAGGATKKSVNPCLFSEIN